jgi:hypothetical protein
MENKEVVKFLRWVDTLYWSNTDSLKECIEQIIKDNNLETVEKVCGEWYWSDCRQFLIKYNDDKQTFGFREKVFYPNFILYKKWEDYKTKATPEEVLQAFTDYAISLGLVKGCRFYSVWSGNKAYSNTGMYTFCDEGNFYLDIRTIFNSKTQEWATPIKQEKVKVINPKLSLEDRVTELETIFKTLKA